MFFHWEVENLPPRRNWLNFRPAFSNSWAFAATLKNNFKMQVSLKSIKKFLQLESEIPELAVNETKKMS